MSVEPSDVLDYWFGGHDPGEAATADRQGSLWWGHDATNDEALRERFATTHAAAARGELDRWAVEPAGRIALVVVLDQLSRNLHRGTPEAFAQDPAARRWSLEIVERNQEREWPLCHRVFLYMPLEHSEDIRHQELSCRRFERLRDEYDADDPRRPLAARYLDYAYRHRDIVARFGRFPHRNAILGRVSSAEELRFLDGPGSSF